MNSLKALGLAYYFPFLKMNHHEDCFDGKLPVLHSSCGEEISLRTSNHSRCYSHFNDTPMSDSL
jgi:hypothetical protein